MNFFQEQANAKKQTKIYFIVFIATVIMTSSIIAATIGHFVFGSSKEQTSTQRDHAITMSAEDSQDLSQVEFTLFVSAGFMALIFGTSILKRRQFAAGGRAVAESLDGRLINTANKNLNERVVLNVVEEMAIAAGCPVPSVYVLNEGSINAFAAGTSIDNAVIGVTQGAIEKLNRDELQAVIGHEFSHILNGDMKLNIKLICWCAGLAFLANIGRGFMRGSNRNKNGGKIGLLLFAAGSIGYFAAVLIQKAISRQREYLADASSVQFTRNKDSMANALAKIEYYSSELKSPKSNQIAHMFFADGIKREFNSFMGTHPPIETRINRINPRFDYESFYRNIKNTRKRKEEAKRNKEQNNKQFNTQVTKNISGTNQSSNNMFTGASFVGVAAAANAPFVALASNSPSSEDLGEEFIDTMKDKLKKFSQEPYTARLIIIALMDIESNSSNEFFNSILIKHLGNSTIKEYEKVSKIVATYQRDDYLSLIDLCLPALREMSGEQSQQFVKCLKAISYSDKNVTFLEFVIYMVVKLSISESSKISFAGKFKEMNNVQAIVMLVCTVVRADNNNQSGKLSETERGIFNNALSGLSQEFKNPKNHLPWSMKNFEYALEKCARFNLKQRNMVLNALVKVIKADNKISTGEYEIIRCISQRLGCPLPLLEVSKKSRAETAKKVA